MGGQFAHPIVIWAKDSLSAPAAVEELVEGENKGELDEALIRCAIRIANEGGSLSGTGLAGSGLDEVTVKNDILSVIAAHPEQIAALFEARKSSIVNDTNGKFLASQLLSFVQSRSGN